MAKTAWPTEAELNAALTAAGVTLPAWADGQDAVDAAVERWASATGIDPWLPDASDVTRTYNPSGSDIVLLRTCYTSITSVSLDGTVISSEAWDAGPGGNAPIEYIDFGTVMLGDPNSISIIGKRGYSASIPMEVWAAVMQDAIGLATEWVNSATGIASAEGDIKSLKQGSVTIEYQDGGKSVFPSFLVDRYRRMI